MSAPGYARIAVRDPRPLRPSARKRRNETQANGGTDITFDCYGADVMVPAGGDAICGGSVPTREPTPKPTNFPLTFGP